MAKFFVDYQNVLEDCILIKGTDVNHIKNVLRLPIGKEILINDGQGNDYQCIIKEISTEVVTATIKNKLVVHTEPAVQTFLFQSLIKGEKMEFVIQKGVEIGVTAIVPIITQRCIVKLESDKKLNNKLERWQKIAESAAKQSKRGIIPLVMSPMTLQEAFEYAQEHFDASCIPFENEQAYYVKSFLRDLHVHSLGIFIGPEGGFTDEEIDLAKKHNVQPITLGKRILRSETAGIVVLANVMYEMGEM